MKIVGLSCLLLSLPAGCSARHAKAPPINAAQAKQTTREDYQKAIAEIESDPKLSTSEKQMLKIQYEQSLEMRLNEIDSVDRAEKGLDPGDTPSRYTPRGSE